MAEGILDLSPPNDREDKPTEEVPKPPEAAPQPIPYELHKKEGRHWPILLVYFLLALIVATGVVFAGRWAYHKVSNTEPNPKSTPTQVKKTPEPAAASKESAGQSAGSSNSNGSVPAPTPTPSPSSSSSTLPKTGDD